MEDYNTGRFSTVSDAVRLMMSLEGDVSSSKRIQYIDAAKIVYESLNLAVIKDTKRVVINVKGHLPIIPCPDDYFDFATLDYVDHRGQFQPMVFNDNLKEKVADLSLAPNCGCECGCNSSMCCSAKNYEAITEEVSMALPNATVKSFTKYIRKYINSDGSFYQEIGEPVKIYDETGTWVDTRMDIRQQFICKLDVKKCGCLEETPNNLTQLQFNCCASNFKHEAGHSSPEFYKERSSTYNLTDKDNRIILPDHFHYDKIIMRYYATIKTKDILIPRLGLKAFMTGIKSEVSLWDKRMTDRELAKWQREHSKAAGAFRSKINRMTMTDFFEYYFGLPQHVYRGQENLDRQYWDIYGYNNEF